MNIIFGGHKLIDPSVELTILFQGDSVTDAGRSRTDDNELGAGYPMYAASWLAAARPGETYRFLNRGISGNRVKDLKDRWTEDCIDLKPDVVSILIGINDTWRKYDSNDPTSAEKYEEDFRTILARVHDELHSTLVLIEPFVLPVDPAQNNWREDLDPKIHVVRKLAREFGAILIPMDGIFASVSAEREPAFWATDGVHPTNAGHCLIAQAWLRATGLL